jgi:hypothetical protein
MPRGWSSAPSGIIEKVWHLGVMVSPRTESSSRVSYAVAPSTQSWFGKRSWPEPQPSASASPVVSRRMRSRFPHPAECYCDDIRVDCRCRARKQSLWRRFEMYADLSQLRARCFLSFNIFIPPLSPEPGRRPRFTEARPQVAEGLACDHPSVDCQGCSDNVGSLVRTNEQDGISNFFGSADTLVRNL